MKSKSTKSGSDAQMEAYTKNKIAKPALVFSSFVPLRRVKKDLLD
jgi:hypothetical protein